MSSTGKRGNALAKVILTFVALCIAAFPAIAQVDLQGHRGARGLMPENTLPAFARALTIGVTTLELDVGVTADGIVVVSHDPTLNGALTRRPSGVWLHGHGAALFSLTYDKIQTYDVGRINPNKKYARRFPTQTPVDGTRIPTLAAVFDLVRRAGNETVRFNIETKLNPAKLNLTPPPEDFAKAVLDVIRREKMESRVTIQSFDWRTLQVVQRLAPNVPTVYLSAQQRWLNNIQRAHSGSSPWTAGFDIDEHEGSVPKLVKAAGGSVWSPYHKEIDADQLREAHALGLKVVVWTVNDAARMDALLDLGVDGIISDYPDRLRAVMAKQGMALPTPTPVTP
ncbi:MAG: glycerophosphodiester phosphodiesterase [Alphaproteobacteria bacterium]|nr:glycerophosphodiester phosphodiesterase [Alphaproteobacteria bacterium]